VPGFRTAGSDGARLALQLPHKVYAYDEDGDAVERPAAGRAHAAVTGPRRLRPQFGYCAWVGRSTCGATLRIVEDRSRQQYWRVFTFEGS
jgi:hypothetical protein